MKIAKFRQIIALVVMAVAVTSSYGQSSEATVASATETMHLTKQENRVLAKKVRQALSRTPGLDATHIYVKVIDGVVTLTGFCENREDIDLAGDVSGKVGGVNSVFNKLTIRKKW